jgi:hypothetical protein
MKKATKSAAKPARRPGTVRKNAAKPDQDWRADMLDRVRAIITKADPEVVEEVKWRKPSNQMRGVPVWSHAGILCTGEMYKGVVKLTFAKGASLDDPSGLFNASLEGNTRRAIDIREGETINERALQALIRAAVALNVEEKSGRSGAKAKPTPRPEKTAGKVKLLSGGNPQIAKGEGDAPVQAYLAAMPGWKQDIGRRVDEIIRRTVPADRLHKAVKWNSPFYGVDDDGWFLNLHCFNRFVRVAFFRGSSLDPIPQGVSKYEDVRYYDILEDGSVAKGGRFEEASFADLVKQAVRLPGMHM